MNIMEKIGDTNYFTNYLEETKSRISGKFTAHAWLKTLDNDSLSMLQRYIDNFDENTAPESINDDEAIDMLTLIKRIIELETNSQETDSGYDRLAVITKYFCNMIVLESLRRKGLVKIEGGGEITNVTMKSSLTKETAEMMAMTKTNN